MQNLSTDRDDVDAMASVRLSSVVFLSWILDDLAALGTSTPIHV